MQFNSNKIAFGRHESFALRFGWLTKGFRELERDEKEGTMVFSDEDSVVRLGVGKNMVSSIRHWMRAARLIDVKPGEIETTKIGKYLFSSVDGKDPYLEDEATIWLIHWLISTNPECATSWFWFFNKYHKPEFVGQEAATALLDFAKENIEAKYSPGTVKKDCAVLLRSYIQGKSSSANTIEDNLDSPLSLIRLVTYSPETKSYSSSLSSHDSLPLGIFGYAITDLLQTMGVREIAVENLMYSNSGYPAPGLVFRLSETEFIRKLELLVNYIPNVMKLDETAGIHQLYLLEDIDPFTYLDTHYANY